MQIDVQTLEALGVSAETLGERIVEQAVESLLNTTGFNPDTEEERSYESRFKKEISARVQKAVDEKIAALAAIHLVPRVGEMIEQADMRITNRFGEATSAPLTFKEYIAHRAEVYMSEEVDGNGKSKAELEAHNESTYNWRSNGPRLTVLMRLYIRETLEKAAKEALNDVNQAIVKSVSKAAQDAIAKAAVAIKVSVSA
jgi:hypothetical protein